EDPDTMLVATYERERDGFDSNDPAKKWGPGSGVWKTTDGGENFRRIEDGLPSVNMGRIGFDWYRADPNIVFAVIESEEIGLIPEDAAHMGIRGESADVGARLTEVTEDGPAGRAGLKSGDIVIAINDETVHSYEDLIRKLRIYRAGDTVSMEVSRNRESAMLDVMFGYRPGMAELLEVEDPVVAAAKAEEEAAAAEKEEGSAAGSEGDDGDGAGDVENDENVDVDADAAEGDEEKPELTEEEKKQRSRELRNEYGTRLGGQRPNVQELQGEDGRQFGGLYKSTDAGESWERINSIAPRPMYFSKVRVDPQDQNYIYVLGIPLYRSSDGGKTFTDDGGRGVHVDHHGMWVSPTDGRHIILGNDGGVYLTRDRMENWDHLNTKAIGQFYHVGVDSRENYGIYGGLQDNGSWGGPNRVRSGRGPVNEDWFRIGGGDGFICFADPRDPDVVYYSSQNGGLGRTNIETGDRAFLRPRGREYRFNWMTPYLLSHHNSGVYYTAGNHVFRSEFQGNEIREISPDLARTDRGSASAFGESRFDPAILYVGTTDGALWRTMNGGNDWENLRELHDDSETDANEVAAEDDTEAGTSGAAETTAETARDEATQQQQQQSPSRASSAGGRGARFAEMLMQRDANENGKLERDEIPERMTRMFERFDQNDDGVIERSEIDAVTGGSEASTPADEDTAEEAETSVSVDEAAEIAGPPSELDPISGTWAAEIQMEGMPEGQGSFTLMLELDAASGVVTGTVDSEMGERSIRNGRYDAEEQELRFVVRDGSGRLDINFRGTLTEDGRMRGVGEAEIPGGQTFEIPFTARRTATPVTGKAALAEAGEPAGGETPRERRSGRRASSDERDPLAGPNDDYNWQTIDQLVPNPMWITSLDPSHHVGGRVYMAIDGHRSNDDAPYLFVSEDNALTWRSIRSNMPHEAGAVRVLREDIESPNVLWVGTEFGLWVSIDRGTTWTEFDSNLPTVAVHEIAQHRSSGEIIAGTHGRSVWICDVTPLRQMSSSAVSQNVMLYEPNVATYWRDMPERGTTNQRFVGENPSESAKIYYSLADDVENITLTVHDIRGDAIKDLSSDAGESAGLHHVEWNLRADVPEGSRRRWGARIDPGSYLIVLKTGDTTLREELIVRGDPEYPDAVLWGEAYDERLEVEEMFKEEEYDDSPWWEGRSF
ncbi:MAG: PDZ domain-containing protein, partial [Planctomycetota bacterium]